ncbi:YceI family protein [Streptomyces sp. AP-93]|uniref:YceI family protein n=1 Tax=Streptomyces sp. AP-93 TaxID=2929048 RepID=UPI001FAEF3E5|nr:YceI family protein [Streptomyces sp. AP-93]MCJ0872122.1 YceI family protein [Streptomyces sp. AP-93]
MNVLTAAPGLTPGLWNVDPTHSEVTFVIRHLMTKVRGHFTAFSGVLDVGSELGDLKVSAVMEAASIATRNDHRDAHVRGAEFLDTDKYPVLTFASTTVRDEDGEYFLDGELTIKDVSRTVSLHIEFNGVGEDPRGGTRAGFSAKATINRTDWGLEFNILVGGEKLLLSDKLDLLLEIQLVRA